jgi:hypothetical protein
LKRIIGHSQPPVGAEAIARPLLPVSHLELLACNLLDPRRGAPGRQLELQLAKLDLELPRALLLSLKRLKNLARLVL